VLDFRNCLLVEQPNGDFAQTIARHLLYTTWQHMLLQRLTDSSDRFLAEFAHKAVKEVAYHRELAREWAIRLGDGTEESARRMADGLDWCWRFIPELFEVDEGLQAAIDAGSRPIRAASRRKIARQSPRSLPKPSSRRPRTSERSSAGGAAITASISAICSPRCSSCRAPILTRPGRWPSISTPCASPKSCRRRTRRTLSGSRFRPSSATAFLFRAGQHLTLRATIDGEEVRRNYSLCTAPDESDWMVTVKRIGGGVFSNWVGDHLKPGDVIDVMPPHGSFTTEFDASAGRHLVGIAGGSGITPVMSLIKTDAQI
jgi:hypothetical protein